MTTLAFGLGCEGLSITLLGLMLFRHVRLSWNTGIKVLFGIPIVKCRRSWPRGNKKIMLNSAEHKIVFLFINVKMPTIVGI